MSARRWWVCEVAVEATDEQWDALFTAIADLVHSRDWVPGEDVDLSATARVPLTTRKTTNTNKRRGTDVAC